MRTDRLQLIGVLVLAGLAVGLLPTCAKPPQWRADLQTVGIRFISARELKGMLDREEDLVLVDARDEVHYQRGHLPGAISIPAEDRPLRDVDVRRPNRLLYPERLPADPGLGLVFYCGGPT
ncbi:MAG: rhodanese-like domain-containing protein [Candidatus Rokuibacteriota bacterium]